MIAFQTSNLYLERGAFAFTEHERASVFMNSIINSMIIMGLQHNQEHSDANEKKMELFIAKGLEGRSYEDVRKYLSKLFVSI